MLYFPSSRLEHSGLTSWIYVLCSVSINRENNIQSMSVFDYTTYPFRVADIVLSEWNNVLLYTHEHYRPIVCLHSRNEIHKDTTNKSP